MPATVDLDRLNLSHGAGARVDVDVTMASIELGGTDYRPRPATVSARVDVSRTKGGHALQLRLATELRGPCMRCLQDAGESLQIEVWEVDHPDAGDAELRSPYVADGLLDVERWAHDAVALAMPQQVVCRADCAGICPVCGESLNDADPAAHAHDPEPDPRWAKLRELTDS